MLTMASEHGNGGAQSRIVQESGGQRPWESRRGPFATSELESLTRQTKDPWTLLVAGVDRLSASVELLREAKGLWGFAPRWRIDDVQVSYAPPGGSVGAHLDNFDVFLLQGRGTRTWSIECSPRPLEQEVLRPGLDVRVLASFDADAVCELSPGDALYLPPRFAHHGVSSHAECLTYSIGFRAPSRAELLLSFSQHVAQRLPEDDRYTDGDILSADEAPCRGAILPSSRNRVRELLRGAINDILEDDQAFEAWVGEVLTARTSGTQLSRMLQTDAKPTLADDVMDDNGPSELGPAAQEAMAEWIASLEANGDQEQYDEAADNEVEWAIHQDTASEEKADREEEARLLEPLESMAAALDAELEAELREVEAHTAEGRPEEAMGSGSLVDVIMKGDDDSPTALRLIEGAAIAYITHKDQSASVFVNGARIAVLRETAAVAYLPRLCASSRIEARDLMGRDSNGVSDRMR